MSVSGSLLGFSFYVFGGNTSSVQETDVMTVILSHVSKSCAKNMSWIINTSISRLDKLYQSSRTNDHETLYTCSTVTYKEFNQEHFTFSKTSNVIN